MPNIIIRPATLQDLPVLLQFEQGVIAAERPFDPTLAPDPIQYYDLPHMIAADHIELLVAEINNEPVASGYARIEDAKHFLIYKKYAYLGFMYTLPAFRGKGINQMIIDALKKWPIGKGMTELRLEVYVKNAQAIKAYEKTGFESLLVEMRKELS